MGMFGSSGFKMDGQDFAVNYNREDEAVKEARRRLTTDKRIESEIGDQQRELENTQREEGAVDQFNRFGTAQAIRAGETDFLRDEYKMKRYDDKWGKLFREKSNAVFDKMFGV